MTYLRLISTTVIFLVLIACNNSKKKGTEIKLNINQTYLDSLDLKLNKISKESIIPGFAISVVNAESLLFNKGYGYSDLKNKESFTENTAQTIASVSKTFIGLSIMKLVENGHLDLDEPINNILPFKIINPHFPNDDITVRHLANHTSTINDDWDDGDKRASWLIEEIEENKNEFPDNLNNDIFYYDGQKISLIDFIKEICSENGRYYSKSNFSKQKPGLVYEYSNNGATLAALIVEIKSGMPFYEFTKKNIFKPLKMNNSSWFYNDLNTKYSKLYVLADQDSTKNVFEFPRYHEGDYPNGQLKTSVNDLSLYLMEMINGYKGDGNLLKKESYATMFKPQLDLKGLDTETDSKLNEDYGIGIFWPISSQNYRVHKGGMIGVYSILYFNPKTEIGAIAISNMADDSFGEIVSSVLKYGDMIGETPAGNIR